MIKISNWSSYQSYKDRKPPWIRFHKTMLDNYEYHSMTAESRALLPMLWLIASEHSDPVSGMIEDSYEKITFRLRMNIKTFEASVLEIESAGFIQLIENKGSNAIVTDSYNNRNETVTSETETETETESLSESCDSSPPNCPIQDIVKIYHEELPMLPMVRVMTKARENQIRQRWREEQKRQTLEWWRKFFAYVSKSDFLTGKTESKDRGVPWMADLEWLTKAGNFAKVIEGKYNA